MAEFETPHFMNQTAARNEDTVHAFRMRFVSFQDPNEFHVDNVCLLYTSPSPRDLSTSRMPSSA